MNLLRQWAFYGHFNPSNQKNNFKKVLSFSPSRAREWWFQIGLRILTHTTLLFLAQNHPEPNPLKGQGMKVNTMSKDTRLYQKVRENFLTSSVVFLAFT